MIITPLQNATRLRPDHNTAQPYIALYNMDSKIYGGEIWTAPVTTSLNRAGDQWLKVESINGVPTSGWVAITHNGIAICKELVDAPTVFEPVTATLYDVDGTARHYVLTPKQ